MTAVPCLTTIIAVIIIMIIDRRAENPGTAIFTEPTVVKSSRSLLSAVANGGNLGDSKEVHLSRTRPDNSQSPTTRCSAFRHSDSMEQSSITRRDVQWPWWRGEPLLRQFLFLCFSRYSKSTCVSHGRQ